MYNLFPIYRTTYGKTIAVSAALIQKPIEVEKKNPESSSPEPINSNQVGSKPINNDQVGSSAADMKQQLVAFYILTVKSRPTTCKSN